MDFDNWYITIIAMLKYKDFLRKVWVSDNSAQVSISNKFPLYFKTAQYKSLTIDPFNTRFWNFAIYSVVFLLF